LRLRAEAYKLYAKADKLLAEADELRAEGDKLYAEADKLHAEAKVGWHTAVIAAYGDVVVKWTGTSCILPNGDTYKNKA
jgi:hypothetical protein